MAFWMVSPLFFDFFLDFLEYFDLGLVISSLGGTWVTTL